MPLPEEVMQDVRRLIARRPPTDPATGEMVYHTRQAAEYREALLDIVDRYGDIESFKEAMRDSGVRPEQELAAAAAPAVPNVMAAPSAGASLMQFARNMMASGPPINPNAQGPQGAPGGAVPGMPASMQPGGSTPAVAGVVQNAGPPALVPRRGTGTVR